jgi:DNA damage-binding protein 1
MNFAKSRLKSLKNEISTINISQSGENTANYCAIGTWTDVGVTILKLPSLEEVDCKKTPGDVIPRSILIAYLSNMKYLFIGLGDGTLVIYLFDPETGRLTESKAYTIGTQQIRLIPFSSNEMDCVLACSDHPSVIHSEGGKLRFANVNIKVRIRYLFVRI